MTKRIIPFLAGLIYIAACSQYDDSSIRQQLQDHESRISKLEQQYKEFQQNINSLTAALEALQKNDYIKTITPIAYGGETIGYTITFCYGDPITIYHGSNGKDGKDGEPGASPKISVKQDSDGAWYWTLNGEWLLDESGNKVKAMGTPGQDGQDGITPQVKIADGYWYVSTDNGKTWVKHEKATGEDGDSFFKSVEDTNLTVVLTLADGTIITLPKHIPLNISFDYEKGLPFVGTIRIPYTITGISTSYEVEAITSHYTWEATVEPSDATHGSIVINSNHSYYDSKVLVFVTAEDGETTTRVLSFERGVFNGDMSFFELTSEAQTITFNLETNLEYEISIPEEAKGWIQLSAGTKTTRRESISFDIDANNDNIREAEIAFISQEQNVYSIFIVQYPGKVRIKLTAGPESGTKAISDGRYEFEDGELAVVNYETYSIRKENGDAYVEVPFSKDGYHIAYPAEYFHGLEAYNSPVLSLYYPYVYPASAKMPYYGYVNSYERNPVSSMTSLAGALRCIYETDEPLSRLELCNKTDIRGVFDHTFYPGSPNILQIYSRDADGTKTRIGIELGSNVSESYTPIPSGVTLYDCDFALMNSDGVVVAAVTMKSPIEIIANHIYSLKLKHSKAADYVPVSKLVSYENYKVRIHGKVLKVGKTGFIINDGAQENIQIYTNSVPTVSEGEAVRIEGLVSRYAGTLEIKDPSISVTSEDITPAYTAPQSITAGNFGTYTGAYSTYVFLQGQITEIGQYKNLTISGSNYIVDLNTTRDLSPYYMKNVSVTGYVIGKTTNLLHIIMDEIEINE